MNGEEFHPEDIPSGPDDDRILTARLKIVLNTLPSAFYFNPTGVLIFGVALVLAGDLAGPVHWSQVLIAVGIQGIGAIAAFLVYRRRRALLTNPLHAENVLLLLQLVLGVCWGVVAWAYWIVDCPANNAAVGMGLFVVTWSTTFVRNAHCKILLTGILTPCAVIAARFATARGYIPGLLLIGEPFWVLYILTVGLKAHHQVGAFLRLYFMNADIGIQLRKTRDDAVAEKRAAEEANAAKSAFIANMSHELRTPLNSILGFSEIISGQALGPSSPHYADYAQDIHDAGAHLLSLINDLLDVAKIEAGRMEIDPRSLDLRYVLEGVERILRDRAEAKHQELTFCVDRDATDLVADERACKQIALNLVSNAVKYTQEGGHIRIRGTRGADGGILLSVEDDGPGIPSDKKEKLFQPFSQVDNRYNRGARGTGLGLSLVRGLAELHKGRVWVESELGQGTKMYVWFPVKS